MSETSPAGSSISDPGDGLTNAERDAQSGGLLRHMMDDTRSLRESEVGVDDEPEGTSEGSEHGENTGRD